MLVLPKPFPFSAPILFFPSSLYNTKSYFYSLVRPTPPFPGTLATYLTLISIVAYKSIFPPAMSKCSLFLHLHPNGLSLVLLILTILICVR